jgi:hypothetical protein
MKAPNLYILSIVTLLCACSTTTAPKAESVQFSGFLGNYDGLQAGGENLALHSYMKPGLSLAGYSHIMFDEPEFLLSEETRQKTDDEDLAAVLAIAEKSMEGFRGVVQVAEEPGPGVLRVRWAITDLKPASKGNIVTGLIPQARMVSTVLGKGTDTHLFVGKIGIEAEVVDSVSGERLIAGVDTRVGANAIRNVGSTWGDVEDAFKFWTKRFAGNLSRLGFTGGRVPSDS